MTTCRKCGGDGWYIKQTPDGEPRQEQCNDCQGTGRSPDDITEEMLIAAFVQGAKLGCGDLLRVPEYVRSARALLREGKLGKL